MNRRQFTQRFAALTAAPLMPANIIASASTSTTQISQQYHWASLIARIHDKASPQMLKRHLSLSDDAALDLYKTLVKNNVVSRPNALGVSHAMNPFKRDFGSSMAVSPQAAFEPKHDSTIKKVKEVWEKIEDIDEHHQSSIKDDPHPEKEPLDE